MVGTNMTVNEPKLSGLVEKSESKTIEQKKFDITELMQNAGTLEVTKEQEEILFADVNENDVNIRPDGLIYLPWMEYATRLRKAFGIKWALLPKGEPLIKNDLVVWGFYLIINGKYMSFAYGEQKYIPSNATMTYCDALEGAKSNALMRCCKSIGISLELWRPSFIQKWIATHGEQYINAKGKQVWRKKGIKQSEIIDSTLNTFDGEIVEPNKPQSPVTGPSPFIKPDEQPKQAVINQPEDVYDVTIKDIKEVKGINRTGKGYTVYNIIDSNDQKWSTFSKTLKEEIEMEALQNQSKVTLKATQNKFGFNILELVKNEPETEVIIEGN